MTIFVFVRHGQATHNLTKAYWDPRERDAPLTDEGVRQAWDLRVDHLADRCDAIFCSPLQRCRYTLTLLLGDMSRIARVSLDDRLMEPQGSAIVNRRMEYTDLKSCVPTTWDLERVGSVNPFDVWVEGGSVGEEGNIGFDRRVRTWTEEMCRRWPNGRILVVSHHDWIASWFRQFGEGGKRKVSIGNGSWVVGCIKS
jgi:broad specificity phosphatase PhoE